MAADHVVCSTAAAGSEVSAVAGWLAGSLLRIAPVSEWRYIQKYNKWQQYRISNNSIWVESLYFSAFVGYSAVDDDVRGCLTLAVGVTSLSLSTCVVSYDCQRECMYIQTVLIKYGS